MLVERPIINWKAVREYVTEDDLRGNPEADKVLGIRLIEQARAEWVHLDDDASIVVDVQDIANGLLRARAHLTKSEENNMSEERYRPVIDWEEVADDATAEEVLAADTPEKIEAVADFLIDLAIQYLSPEHREGGNHITDPGSVIAGLVEMREELMSADG